MWKDVARPFWGVGPIFSIPYFTEWSWVCYLKCTELKWIDFTIGPMAKIENFYHKWLPVTSIEMVLGSLIHRWRLESIDFKGVSQILLNFYVINFSYISWPQINIHPRDSNHGHFQSPIISTSSVNRDEIYVLCASNIDLKINKG